MSVDIEEPAVPPQDFWRSGSTTGLLPDGSVDTSEGIFRTGRTTIDTGTPGYSGLVLDDLRSRNSTQQGAGDGGVTDTNMSALGVDLFGNVRLANQMSIPDLRSTNPNPQDYAAGFSNVFKTAALIGLTGTNIPTYVNLTTTRQYAQGTDFSGGQVRQDVDLPDGRQFYRLGTGATTWGPWQLEGLSRNLQTRFTSQATTKISIAGEVRWVGFYHIMSRGVNSVEPAGYFRIDMPADGFAVPVHGAAARPVVAALAGSPLLTGGILLNNWETLYYKQPIGQGATFVPANLLIVPYNANTQTNSVFLESDDWIMIAQRDDGSAYRLGTGDVLGFGGQIGRGGYITSAEWAAMKQRVMGSGYFFAPGGNTASPLAFGFTGTIRWMAGGSTANVNSSGYTDVSNRTVGQVVRGVNNAAARTWRLMTAAEKPGWFGGMQRGNDPILAASTTVVDLNDNETLYWVPNLDSPTTGEWVVAGYSGVVPVSEHWLPVASRQITGAQSTIQVLLGGVQYALKAGDARYTSTNDATMDAIRRNQNIQFRGPAYCRFTTAGFFAGAAANGLLGGADGFMVSWDNNTLMYGISDGYANFGNQYTWIDVPPAGTAIPVVSTNSNITRVVQTIGAHRYIPLGTWEALFWIPPAYSGGNTSVAGDWVISYYGSGNQHLPPSAVMIAKAFSNAVGQGVGKTRIKFADGSYIQPGLSIATATFAEYDHAQGSGDWRAITVAGQTPPGATAPVPAVAGVANQSAAFHYVVTDSDARGRLELDGYINITANVPDGTMIGFIPGMYTRSSGQIMTVTARHAGNNAIPGTAFITLNNASVGGQNGVQILLYGMSAANVAISNGGANGPSGVVSLAGIFCSVN
jgi:hypothetical protein